MKGETRISIVLALLTVAFSCLGVHFLRVPARPADLRRPPLAARDTLAIQPGTVRISAGQLIASGGDVSGLDCYSCHHQDSPPEIKFDDQHRIILPREHADLIISMRNCAECHSPKEAVKLEYNPDGTVIMPKAHADLLMMKHGRNYRNENCYNCHERNQLDHLHTPEGQSLRLDQATLLCGGCHGPNYRDWEAGVHGRVSGYWNAKSGPKRREECTSCHDPHAPAFTGIIPQPGPHLLHPEQGGQPAAAPAEAPASPATPSAPAADAPSANPSTRTP